MALSKPLTVTRQDITIAFLCAAVAAGGFALMFGVGPLLTDFHARMLLMAVSGLIVGGFGMAALTWLLYRRFWTGFVLGILLESPISLGVLLVYLYFPRAP